MTTEEMIKAWAKGAKSSQILNMTHAEVVEFAEKNNFAIYGISAGYIRGQKIVGWRLYETHLEEENGEPVRVPDKLYYVVRSRDL